MQAQTIPTQRTDYASIPRNYSTEEAAGILKVKPQTLRAAVCRDGHYAGVKPRKLPSRFLAWNADEIDALVRSEAA